MHYESVLINMRNCEVNALTTTIPSFTHTYDIYTPIEYLEYAAYGQTHLAGTDRTPAAQCGYTIDYSAMWRTYYNTVIALPSFITWNHAQLRFEIQSNSPSDLTTTYQTYSIELTGTTRITDMSPVYSHTETYTLVVGNGCTNDVLSLVSHNFDTSFIYYINENTDSTTFPQG